MTTACDSAGIVLRHPLRRRRPTLPSPPPPLSPLHVQQVIIIILFTSSPLYAFTPVGGGNHSTTLSVSSRNEIVGEPFVSCTADAIYAKWRTRETFAGGRVSVRFAPNRTCYQVLVTNNQIELLVPHLDCRLQRLRVLDPPGVVIEASVLISFHDEFVSAGDRIFLLKCLHLRAGNANGGGRRSNDSVVLLSPLSKLTPNDRVSDSVSSDTAELNAQTSGVDPPAARPVECRYDIRSSDDVLREREPLTIGTPLIHEWSCRHTKPNQCLLVTNCVMHAVADLGEEHRLVDAVGCPLYPALMPSLDYVDRMHVRELVRLFAVADRPFIRFQCQLNLVDVVAENGIHPAPCPVPWCNDAVEGIHTSLNNTVRRKRHRSVGDRSVITRLIDQPTTQILDAISRRLAVEPFSISSPADDFAVGEEDAAQEAAAAIDGDVMSRGSADDTLCVSAFPLLLFAVAASLAAAFTLTLYALSRLHRERHLRRTVVGGRTSSAYGRH